MRTSLLASFFFTLLLVSCTKKGCADPLADNYDRTVKKAQNQKCTYNVEQLSPCGNFVQFCAKKNNVSLSGPMTVTSFSKSKELKWESNKDGFKQLVMEVYDLKEGNFTASNSEQPSTFKAVYTDSNGVTFQQTGTLKITSYSEQKGASGILAIKFDDGSELKDGFIYRVK